MTVRFKIAGADIVHEDFGGDLVVLNLASGQYFGLNTTGAALWAAIIDGHDPTAGQSDANAAVVSAFVAQLLDYGLIVPDDTLDASTRQTAVSFTEAPVIEAYDDLADLIVADPIHDVDADAGWPKRPEDK